jgi:3'-phosphoadenosine 5'-phosphosulfate sulfotransferase (PAPS reductase)/FAD synthetase
MTQQRIREWIREYGVDGVYVSFSGGKDSTVLLHIVRDLYPEVKAVFIDTGLEYPEIRDFVKTFDNVDIIRPKLTFKQVIDKYGYPFFSKEVSEVVYGARQYLTRLNNEAIIAQASKQASKQAYKYRYDQLVGAGIYSKKENERPIRRRERKIINTTRSAGDDDGYP